ncbi:NACHT nucleoside triphosphatase [Penicillium canescens]|uniref:NACHT nucleoside triphosphatase n=1 Tax=Penicillium canescens TaxID=5083 RepID=A0AAD6I1X1_PENCN|nr:NACHT nucleoside triphosphatase [Penicillium canescens]KAJ6027441.1 NACHT nucleoside triphosphatase [Penicillium canescens]KAJ6040718.1 NACHT nucleoside triphosphatase [Penicillium canescens]KAJ6066929.1 NACHT nucleoside triphosphatase [Penicillium canescens]
MADPIAIASGIVGLLSLGIQVTQSLVDFYTAYKDQDTDVAKIAQNLDNLQGTFRSLDVAVRDRRSQADTQELFEEVEKATLRCDKIIKELHIECQKFQKDLAAGFKARIHVAGRRAAYPFRKSTLQKLEKDVGEIRENLSFALDVLQLKSHNEIHGGISEVKSLVERTNASQVSFTIRAWLVAPDASLNHNAACAKSHRNTGLWFVNGHHFRNWLHERNSFLWLNGFAGCGKSVLCSTAIQHTFRVMRHIYGVGIAFFYFSFNDEAKQDDNGMLRALLLQLSVQLQGGERDLEQLHALYKSGSPPVDALLGSLQRFLNQFHNSYILLDALDESPRDSSRAGVLRAIQEIRSWSISSVHLLVTSRNERDIRKSLDPSHHQGLSMRNSEIDRDIENFVSYELENDAKLQKWEARHEEIRTKLTTGAQGVFRYVECQLNALRQALNRNQLDGCLRTLPRDLDETYERILCSISDEYVEDVRRVLTVLCFSTRPLTVNELIDAHAVELSEPPHLDRDGRSYEQDDLIDICLGLIEIAATEDNNGQNTLTVRIAHSSVQEYLQSDRILQQKAQRFAMRSAPANTEIAQICLVYLLEPTLSRETLDQAKLTEFPFAHFAATHWFHHYANSKEGKTAIEQLVSKLFKTETKAFVTWIRLHDMDRPWNMNVHYNRPLTDMALPLYYAGLLGLESVLNSILPIDTTDANLSDTVNAQGGWFGNALQAAAEGGHERVVQMLLDRGADVNVQGGFYGNALQAASYGGHAKVVQMLLDRGADVNVQGGDYDNALQAASSGGHEKAVQMLLDRGADVNAQREHYGNALQAASRGGYEKAVQMLLDRGADVNARGGHYDNALQAASYGGHEKVVQMLLDRGADVNAQHGHYGNALQFASYGGHEKVVQMLLDRGADVNAQRGHYDNALQAASYGGHEKVVQMLLDRGADVNVKGGDYCNALQAASCGGHEKLVKMLLDRDADVNVQGGFYGNALQAASSGGHEKVVQMLLDRGADVNVQGGDYDNALQAASSGGHEKAVQMLLDRGADVNAQGGHYDNALQAASYGGHEKVVQLLLDRGVNVNAQGGHYDNALQAASRGGHENVVQMLLYRGADVNVQGGRHGNALQAASRGGHEKLVQMLLDRDADVSVRSEELSLQ